MTGFRIESARTVHSGPVVETEMVQVRTPDGDLVERQVVRHPGAVAAVVFDRGDVVLVRQYRAALDADLVEIPAGKLDVDGEDRADAIRRELVEEVGLQCASLVEMGSFVTAAGFCDEEIAIYFASDCTDVGRQVDGVEEAHAEIVRVPVTEIERWIHDGRLRDSKTLVGLAWALGRGLLVGTDSAD